MIRKNLGEEYSPMYFLGALGAGGTAVTFFMFLMFMTPYDTPIPTYEAMMALMTGEGPLIAVLVGAAMAGILFFVALHLRLLVWNIREYRQFRRTEAFARLRRSNQEVALMAIPLTLAMTINAGFIVGAVFVPGLWNVVEYLFPLAMLAFLAVGAFALVIYSRFLARLFTEGDFDFTGNNNLSQLLAVFAFAMIAVGLAAPGAMSENLAINAAGIFFSLTFAALALVLGLVMFVLGFKSTLRYGIAEAASPSLWIAIPILTLLGIAFIRHQMGLHHGFGAPLNEAMLFVFTSLVLGAQLVFGLIGYVVMKKLGYFRDYIHGEKKSPVSYALICPGVALVVFSWFFINLGLVSNGVVEQFSVAYFALLAPVVYLQVVTIATLFRLNRKLLRAEPATEGASQQA
ncbi:hypothetical protein [Thioalkalivibrio sp. AKL17]|uniref:TsoY family (seleno)protein n=1 Tax=Thioalkalivibrio sp. AKL17 TaxID=1158160 RepID=UPI00036936F7|nr:hypothetical protein [Thioalkalivibrio sp. AKL17]